MYYIYIYQTLTHTTGGHGPMPPLPQEPPLSPQRGGLSPQRPAPQQPQSGQSEGGSWGALAGGDPKPYTLHHRP